jgi:hypothetical protein
LNVESISFLFNSTPGTGNLNHLFRIYRGGFGNANGRGGAVFSVEADPESGAENRRLCFLRESFIMRHLFQECEGS